MTTNATPDARFANVCCAHCGFSVQQSKRGNYTHAANGRRACRG